MVQVECRVHEGILHIVVLTHLQRIKINQAYFLTDMSLLLGFDEKRM